jgi:hypothetical protein
VPVPFWCSTLRDRRQSYKKFLWSQYFCDCFRSSPVQFVQHRCSAQLSHLNFSHHLWPSRCWTVTRPIAKMPRPNCKSTKTLPAASSITRSGKNFRSVRAIACPAHFGSREIIADKTAGQYSRRKTRPIRLRFSQTQARRRR